MTLEDLLRATIKSSDKDGNEIEVVPDFRVAVQAVRSNGVHFIIHPNEHNGETLDFVATGNEIEPLQ